MKVNLVLPLEVLDLLHFFDLLLRLLRVKNQQFLEKHDLLRDGVMTIQIYLRVY